MFFYSNALRHRLVVLGLFSYCVMFAQESNSSFINDSTIARYRYEVEESTVAQVPDGTKIGDLDYSEKDFLKTLYSHTRVARGVNNSYEVFCQIENVQTTEAEDWMSTPPYQLIAPSGSYGFNETGEVLYHFPLSSPEVQQFRNFSSLYSSEGYRPIMLFFPNIHDEFVEDAEQSGAILYELDNEAFKLVWTDKEILFEPETKTITRWRQGRNREVRTVTKYSLYAPYGYVIGSVQEESTRTDLDRPVTFVTRQLYSNHVIEDESRMIPRYTEQAHIVVHPVPVKGSYDVVFKGMPDVQVSQVQIRDYMGNIVHTHYAPDVDNEMMTLDGSEYPSGVLILIVYTQQGIYTETFTKS